MKKLLRITTVPVSLKILLKGQHRFMSRYFEVVGVSSPGKELTEVADNEGIRVVPLEMKRQVSLLNDFISLVKMYRLIKNEKPEIIHTHTPKAGLLGMLAGWMARVPVRLHTVAGLPLMEASGVKRIILNGVEKLTYACATRVYPNSFGLQDFILQQQFCAPTKLKVIGNGSSNGIDTTHFSPAQVSEESKAALKKELNIEPGDFVFVFIGRLVRDKGINELVSAFGKLAVSSEQLAETSTPYSKLKTENYKLQTANCKLLLVGSYEENLDPLLPSTKKTIEENPDIIHVGHQSDVRSFFAIADALVFPSYREGFPNVVMQAGAMGLPSIVTDINGCNEIIVEGENGEIIPPKDENALYEKMKEWLEQPEKASAMASNARSLVESRYEQQMVWNAVLEEYDKLLNR